MLCNTVVAYLKSFIYLGETNGIFFLIFFLFVKKKSSIRQIIIKAGETFEKKTLN